MTNKKPKFQKQRPPDQFGVDTGWRLFVAIPMPPSARELVERVTATLANHDWPVRWVGSEAAHLTLHFLGETPPERAELLRMALAPVVARHAEFTLTTGELGTFPHEGQPRVLWLGLTGGTRALSSLQRAIGQELRRHGVEVEERGFHPHVTLGRVREGAPATLAGAVRDAYADPAFSLIAQDEAVEIPVSEVLLVRSFLERGGARHVPLGTYRLSRSGS